ncbi:MAG: hypothetical protein WBV82_12995 [Myxococcaceae bacterium]
MTIRFSGTGAWTWPVVVGLALAGCDRCGGGREGADAGRIAAGDAGTPSPLLQGTRGALHATDLRSAMILIFPEFRGAHVKGGRAVLEREVTWSPSGSGEKLSDIVAPQLKRQGYGAPDVTDATLTAKRPPFELEVRRTNGQVVSTIALPLEEGVMNKLLHSPSPMGTEHLSTLIPRLPGETAARESFRMELNYVAKPDRANFLVRSLVEDLMGVGWKPATPLVGWEPTLPDGGAGPIPEDLELALVNEDTGGRLEIERRRGEVVLRYLQPLRSR